MDKDEALYEIYVIMERVKMADRFNGRRELMKRLDKLHDLVNLYKPDTSYYGSIVKEAKTLFNELQRKLDDEAKGGK